MRPIRIIPPLFALAALAAAPAHVHAQTSPRTVPIRLSEYRIEAADSVKTGDVVLAVTNAGHEAHVFLLRGHRTQLRTPFIQPGQTASLPVRLIAGDYLMYCAVKANGQEHRKLGMEKHLRVVW